MYYEPATQTVYDSIQDFRVTHLHTSFGQLDSESERNQFGLFTVKQNPPAFDSEFNMISPNGIVEVNGEYEMSYVITPRNMTDEERDARLLGRFTRALNEHMDTTAQQRRYDNRITCSLRAGYPSIFQQEGLAFATWMDACNATAYQIWAQVKAGQRPVPESVEAFIALLPAMEWPPSPIPQA